MYGEVRPPLVSLSRPKDVPCLEEGGEARIEKRGAGQRKSGSDCALVRNDEDGRNSRLLSVFSPIFFAVATQPLINKPTTRSASRNICKYV